ncbi:inositol monophosphatase family protein [Amnibacterium setariae]|uniref:Inositol-1-monophosphatase n=1 Tax=Amnibacterium setariae TaxID=2306585 RepID=A0A3A1TRS1_9MICO|nr:inositol monophosphatase family protein [Amnibacterium setariae]RIX26385.1 inositol monophosphatase [Amnibacterium setariae]
MAHEELLEIARSVAEEAGALAARLRREGVEVAATKSSPIDIVTAADRATEDLIRGRLAALRPADGFLGEESGGEAGTSGLTWVVDPIDGTVNYLYDLPNWSVSIAVVEGDPDPETWTALAGAVAAPQLGELYTASAGGGAFVGDRRLQVREAVPLNRALVATGFHYTQEIRTNQARVAQPLLARVRDLRRAGGAAIDLAYVAAGRIDAYFEQGLNPWDQAAGALLVREAGGVVRGLDSPAANHRMTIAGQADVVDELLASLRELGA